MYILQNIRQFWHIMLADIMFIHEQSCFVSKEITDVTVTRGTLWSNKYNNIGTFEQICYEEKTLICKSGESSFVTMNLLMGLWEEKLEISCSRILVSCTVYLEGKRKVVGTLSELVLNIERQFQVGKIFYKSASSGLCLI